MMFETDVYSKIIISIDFTEIIPNEGTIEISYKTNVVYEHEIQQTELIPSDVLFLFPMFMTLVIQYVGTCVILSFSLHEYEAATNNL